MWPQCAPLYGRHVGNCAFYCNIVSKQGDQRRKAVLLHCSQGGKAGLTGLRGPAKRPGNEVRSQTVDINTVLSKGFSLIHPCCLSIHRLPLSKSPRPPPTPTPPNLSGSGMSTLQKGNI